MPPRGKHNRKGDFTRGKRHRPAHLIAAENREVPESESTVEASETKATGGISKKQYDKENPSLPSTRTTAPTPGSNGAGDTDKPEDGTDAEEGEDEEDGEGGSFRRRNLGSNAWRYEQLEEELNNVLDAETSEPEEDYGKLVIEKLKKKEEAEGELREPDFARESKVTAAQKNPFLPPDDSVEKRHGKGKIQVVDRRDFQDIVEKSAKQSAAQAFRQKFASNKKGISRKQNDDSKQEEAVDIDSFLEDILAPKPKAQTVSEKAKPRPIAESLKAKTTIVVTKNSTPAAKGQKAEVLDDDWLDEMLGGR